MKDTESFRKRSRGPLVGAEFIDASLSMDVGAGRHAESVSQAFNGEGPTTQPPVGCK